VNPERGLSRWRPPEPGRLHSRWDTLRNPVTLALTPKARQLMNGISLSPLPNGRRLSIALQTLFEHPLVEEAPATGQVSPSLSTPKRDFLSLSAPIKQDFHLLTFVSGEYYAHCLFWHQG
jgi:hypothetical protein